MYVGDYVNSGHFNHASKRDRKLLLNKIELNKINKKLKNKGLTIVTT
jgi:SsrA-binding protein